MIRTPPTCTIDNFNVKPGVDRSVIDNVTGDQRHDDSSSNHLKLNPNKNSLNTNSLSATVYAGSESSLAVAVAVAPSPSAGASLLFPSFNTTTSVVSGPKAKGVGQGQGSGSGSGSGSGARYGYRLLTTETENCYPRPQAQVEAVREPVLDHSPIVPTPLAPEVPFTVPVPVDYSFNSPSLIHIPLSSGRISTPPHNPFILRNPFDKEPKLPSGAFGSLTRSVHFNNSNFNSFPLQNIYQSQPSAKVPTPTPGISIGIGKGIGMGEGNSNSQGQSHSQSNGHGQHHSQVEGPQAEGHSHGYSQAQAQVQCQALGQGQGQGLGSKGFKENGNSKKWFWKFLSFKYCFGQNSKKNDNNNYHNNYTFNYNHHHHKSRFINSELLESFLIISKLLLLAIFLFILEHYCFHMVVSFFSSYFYSSNNGFDSNYEGSLSFNASNNKGFPIGTGSGLGLGLDESEEEFLNSHKMLSIIYNLDDTHDNNQNTDSIMPIYNNDGYSDWLSSAFSIPSKIEYKNKLPRLIPFDQYHAASSEYTSSCRHFLYKENEEALWFSGERQDYMLYHNIFGFKLEGRFVDIGSNKAIWGSNSFFFEKCLNWTGLCIEPNVHYHDQYNQRSCQLIKYCVSDHEQVINMTNLGPNSRFSRSYDDPSLIYQATCKPLKSILKEYDFDWFDLASIDVEGGELDVLKDFSLRDYRVKAIIIESAKHPQRVMDHVFHKNGYSKVTDIAVDALYEINKKIVHNNGMMFYPANYQKDFPVYEPMDQSRDYKQSDSV